MTPRGAQPVDDMKPKTVMRVAIHKIVYLLKTFMMQFWRKGGRKKYFKITDGLLY